MDPSDDIGQGISFSYTTYSYAHEFGEVPVQTESLSTGETIPLAAFRHASTMQAAARYLVDVQKLSFTAAARLLGRSPKTIWTSYHQAKPLPKIEESLPIPISILTGARAPLEALVLHLKTAGLRNIDIARALDLDPKTTWTAAKRGEARR